MIAELKIESFLLDLLFLLGFLLSFSSERGAGLIFVGDYFSKISSLIITIGPPLWLKLPDEFNGEELELFYDFRHCTPFK